MQPPIASATQHERSRMPFNASRPVVLRCRLHASAPEPCCHAYAPCCYTGLLSSTKTTSFHTRGNARLSDPLLEIPVARVRKQSIRSRDPDPCRPVHPEFQGPFSFQGGCNHVTWARMSPGAQVPKCPGA